MNGKSENENDSMRGSSPPNWYEAGKREADERERAEQDEAARERVREMLREDEERERDPLQRPEWAILAYIAVLILAAAIAIGIVAFILRGG
jgi:cytoskeletal protein RodZ